MNGNEARLRTPGAGARRGPVVSTSCLVIALLAAFVILVVLPVGLWLLGIFFGAA